MTQVAFLEAHDSEVLCLEFTRPASGRHGLHVCWVVMAEHNMVYYIKLVYD